MWTSRPWQLPWKPAGPRVAGPSFIGLRTTIAWPAPTAQNTGKAHGSALGGEEVAATKRILGFDPDTDFFVAPEVLSHAREVGDRAKALRADWDERYAAWRTAEPKRAALLDRLVARELPEDWEEALPEFEPSSKKLRDPGLVRERAQRLGTCPSRAVRWFG